MLTTIIKSINLSTPERKTLLTPGFVNPGLLKRSLALKAGNLANFVVRPMAEFFAEQSVGMFPGKTYISGERLFWLMFDLLKRNRKKLKYLDESVEFEGLCSLMIDTIAELRLNGIGKTSLSKLPLKPKWNDIAFVMDAYEEAKGKGNLFDYADAAGELVKSGKPVTNTYLIKHNVTSLEQQLIDSLGIKLIGLEVQGPASYTLSGYKVDTPYQEALQTVRNVMDDLRTATAPVRIGICTPDYNSSFSLLRPVLETLFDDSTSSPSLFKRRGKGMSSLISPQRLDSVGGPDLIHFLKGEPLLSTPAGNLWKYFAEWAQNSFSVYRLIRVIESGSLDREAVVEESPKLKGQEISPSVYHHAVRYFKASELVLFNSGFLPAFREYLSGRTTGDADEEKEKLLQSAVDAALAIGERFEVILAPPSPIGRLEALAGLYRSLVKIRSDSDAATVAKIESLIDGLLASLPPDDPDVTLSDLLTIVNERLDGLYVNARLPDFTRPVLGTLDDLRYLELDKLYITGLNEKGLPRRILQNPLLLDVEKARLKDAIPSSQLYLMEDYLRENDEAFERFVGATKDSLVLSAPLKDLGTGRERLVSRYMLDLWNRHFKSRKDYRSISTALGEDPRSQNNHVTAQPGDAFHEYEIAVSARILHHQDRLKDPLLAADFPFARSIAGFKSNRKKSRTFNEYWGIVKRQGDFALPVFSASRISRWARCPYGYFLDYELKLDRTEDFDALSLEWLDNMSYGSFVHEVFYRFFIRLRSRKGDRFNRIAADDEDLLWQVFDEVTGEYKLMNPVNSTVHYTSQIAQLRRDVELFLRHELNNKDTRLYVELAFHMPVKEGREPLLRRSEPAEITLGDGTVLKVRGSIDRVDRSAEGRFVLYDYKTGKVDKPRADNPFGGGKLIQAGLYSEVISQIDPAITNPVFTFYYTSEKAGFAGYRVEYGDQRDHFIAFLSTIMDEIRNGHFVPVADGDYGVCHYCELNDVCVAGRRGTADSLKVDDPHYQRLLEIRKENV